MNDHAANAAPASGSKGTTAPLVFIHAAPRTSSTWFWTKFRALPSVIGYYEPFNASLNWLTEDRVQIIVGDSWNSRHPPTDPYYREYIPLLQKPQGVQLFDPAMTLQWFIPHGGLRGELRPEERNYLSLMIRHARDTGKVPVLGDCWSLGRAWAIKQALGGFHILQYRNLWRQWLSYLSYKREGNSFFFVTVMDIICLNDDPYFAYLVEHGLKHAAEPGIRESPTATPALRWRRMYPFEYDMRGRQLELLPEHHAFALFMGLHVYLYLHAQLTADLAVDVTRLSRDDGYRSGIEQSIREHAGLAISLSGGSDVGGPAGIDVDVAAIDWEEIREHARVAVRMLSRFGDPARLMQNATALIDATMAEMRASVAPMTVLTGSAAAGTSDARELQRDAAPAAAVKRGETDVKTIGLCMIVKNEAQVILRCLESVRPLLDYVVIEDTGSTDGTQGIIREWLARVGLPGEVVEEPWQNFAYNRTHVLARLRERSEIDYAFMIDADDRIEIDPGLDVAAFKSGLTADFYDVEIHHSSIVHHRPHLYRNALPFTYRGVLHEFVEVPQGQLTRATLAGFHIVIVGGGARSQDTAKFQRDAALLERALETEQDAFLRSRYTFYLAQSFRDFGDKERSLAAYLARSEMGFWDQEVYVALCEAAKLQADIGRPAEEVLATWQRAIDTFPGRAEAFHGASRYCRLTGRNQEGFQIASRGLALTEAPPPAGLFVEQWVYEYGLLDEYAVNGYWSGHFRECLDASLRILSHPNCPEGQRQRFLDNVKFAAGNLPNPPSLGSFGRENLVDQHTLVPARNLRSTIAGAPRVLVAILAKQKEKSLPLYLECIEALDYPKSSIVLYIRTNNNTDGTERILREWVARVGHLYAGVEFDAEDVAARVEQFGVHEWNATRFRVLGRIRNISLRRALEHDCDFYFVSDVDNFVRPCTLRELVALNLPIVAPLLRSINPRAFYSNFHAEIDADGYLQQCDQYHWILNRWVRGVLEMPVVHCTYLIRADALNELTYEDTTSRHEYVVFSHSARKSGVPQYIDNRQVYGYITFDEGDSHYIEGGIDQVRALLSSDEINGSNDAIVGSTEQGACESHRTLDGDTACIQKKRVNIYRDSKSTRRSDLGTSELPAIHFINLDRSTERLQRFLTLNCHLKNIVRVPAVDGSALDREILIQSGYIDRDLSYPPGALGCAISHLKLWEMAASEDRSITVLEDDVVVSYQFENRVREVLSIIPDDWDIIQWGHIFGPLYLWVDHGMSAACLHSYGTKKYRATSDWKEFQARETFPAPLKLLHSFGLQGYSISAKGARSALEYCLPLRDRIIEFPEAGVRTPDVGIDVTLCGLYPTLKSFVCIPPLVIHDETQTSDRKARE